MQNYFLPAAMDINKPILKIEDIKKITRFLIENGYDKYGLKIVTDIDDHDFLEKVNEEYFYGLGGKNEEEMPKVTDEIHINVGNIVYVYKYVPDEDN